MMRFVSLLLMCACVVSIVMWSSLVCLSGCLGTLYGCWDCDAYIVVCVACVYAERVRGWRNAGVVAGGGVVAMNIWVVHEVQCMNYRGLLGVYLGYAGVGGWFGVTFVCAVSLDYLCIWRVQVSVYCALWIPAHIRYTQCSILLHIIDICFLTCICPLQMPQNPGLLACGWWTCITLDIARFYEEHCQTSSGVRMAGLPQKR